MESLILNEFSTLSDIESAMQSIVKSSSDGLQLPKDVINKRRGAMHDAARLQALITWARRAKHPHLQFHASNTIERVLEELPLYAPGIVAIRLADEIRIGASTISRRDALVRAAEKMRATDAFDLPNIIRGRSIDMTCVAGAKVQYLRPLFFARNSDAVKKGEGMHQMLQALINYINGMDAALIPDSLLRALGIFASELFSNTQEHATSDEFRAPYAAHVEGMIVSWNQLDEQGYASDFSSHPRLQQFWRDQSIEKNDGKRSLRCIQMSFFDSGPGFASRTTGRSIAQIDLQEERVALLKCLQKNTTTKKQAGAGQGLPGVLQELSQSGGLIRIRSGRHDLFNVFEGGSDSVQNLFDFSDWRSEELAPAAGATVSLIIPLRRETP